ncbi:MAG: hypothetical protein E7624_06595 [Ruminococcaceae bacterium]|nr:hypothetical protein [Oscillospiraceae bacterium]
MIRTICGDLSKESLGFTLPHEHILIDMENCVDEMPHAEFHGKITPFNRYLMVSDPYYIKENASYVDEDVAVRELLLYKQYGGQSIVDVTPDDIGRDVRALRRIAERTGLNIIVGCGHYTEPSLSDTVKNMSVTQLADEIIRDVTTGVQGTDMRAGVIGEIGTSAEITAAEQKCVEAALIAARETGASVHFHTSLWEENGKTVLEIAKKLGTDPARICIDHIDVDLRYDYCKYLLDEGAWIEFDNCGKEFFMPPRDCGKIRGKFAYDMERAEMIARLLSDGYGDRLLVTNDLCLRTMLAEYGGNGFMHVARTILPMLRYVGVTEQDIHRLTVQNPADFLDF